MAGQFKVHRRQDKGGVCFSSTIGEHAWRNTLRCDFDSRRVPCLFRFPLFCGGNHIRQKCVHFTTVEYARRSDCIQCVYGTVADIIFVLPVHHVLGSVSIARGDENVQMGIVQALGRLFVF